MQDNDTHDPAQPLHPPTGVSGVDARGSLGASFNNQGELHQHFGDTYIFSEKDPKRPQPSALEQKEWEAQYLESLTVLCRELAPYWDLDFGDGGKSKYFVRLNNVNVKRRVVSVVGPEPNVRDKMRKTHTEQPSNSPPPKAGSPRPESGPYSTTGRESPRPEPVMLALSEIFRLNSRIVLLGKPGMGKSTAAQSFALNCIEPAASADATKPALIPVFLRLRAHSDEIGKIGLEQLLMNQISRIGSIDAQQSEYLLEDWIKTSRLFIILDGLDEISSESARRLSDQLRVFGNSAKGLSCRILLTSRRTGYAGVDHAFTEYEIQPLEDRAAAIEFVIGWLSAIRSYSREQAQTDAEQLVSSIDARSGFRSICTDPLLLYLAVRIYESTGHMEAGNRAELLALYVKTLYEKHDKPSEIVAVKIPLDQVMRIMALAAWVLHIHEPQGPLTIAQIVSAIRDSAQDAKNVSEVLSLAHKTLGLLQKSSVTKVTPEVDFSHAHFRDYFVALRMKLAWEADSDRTKTLIKPLLHAPNFQEPLLMLAAMLPDETANQFIQFVADADSDFKFELSRDLLLAAEMLTVRPYKETDFSRWVIRRTVYRYLLHITILSPDGANHRKIQERIETLLHDLGEPARALIVDSVVQDAQTKPAKQKRDWWRKSAIIAIGKLKVEGPAVSALLLEAMTEDYSFAQAAMFALGEVGPASDEVIFALLNASGRPGWEHPNWIAQHAVEALYRIGERNPDLVKKL